MFDSTRWAAQILGCNEDEAYARVKVAQSALELKDNKKYRRGIDPAAWPELIENGGAMARLRKLAQSDDPDLAEDAAKTVKEIEEAFWNYAKEKDTAKYALKLLCGDCGEVRLVSRREAGVFTLVCGHKRQKDIALPVLEEECAR